MTYFTNRLSSLSQLSLGVVASTFAWACGNVESEPTEPIPPEATAIHGLTAAAVAGAPPFPDLYPRLRQVLRGRTILTYNTAFDSRILAGVLARHALGRWRCQWACAMLQWAAYVGDWSETHGAYVWHPLPGATHSAAGDCQAVVRLLHRMAASM